MSEYTGSQFEIIAKAKQALLDTTNIEASPEEMKVLNDFLFRCWQMGWLDKYEKDLVEVVRCKDCIHNDQCKHRVVMWVEDPINTWHKDIDFCSYGERKDNEDK